MEERAEEMEARQGIGVAEEVARLREKQRQESKERREKGIATVGDTIGGWFGW